MHRARLVSGFDLLVEAQADFAVIPAGPGHYIATGVTIPLAGRWRVTARALLTPIDEATVVGTVDIG